VDLILNLSDAAAVSGGVNGDPISRPCGCDSYED
jgi:hypothetical protein